MGLLKFLEDYAAEKAGYIPPDQREEPDHFTPDNDMTNDTANPAIPEPATAADDHSPKLVPGFETVESPESEESDMAESKPESPELRKQLQDNLEESELDAPESKAPSPVSNVNRFERLNMETVNQAMENLRAAMESAKAISGERAKLQKELDDLAGRDKAITLREKSIYAKITQHQITINRHLNRLNPNDK